MKDDISRNKTTNN